ncbi:flagellar basal body P-ring formation chaperone FlgA [Vibrio zhugei]|uniref:Flagella basal body P-ring formation protein FlgA n=1 Tax=Vibrio zhugei TaxID=2479546 RepID=A0ABV7C323_9VIBR|nr:flagellar basal body P-ring formation chaperone FlgA [Vibrio zhugei]
MKTKPHFALHASLKCRTSYKTFNTFIGFLLLFFSTNVLSATVQQIKSIQHAAEQHVLNTVDAPRGGKVSAVAADIDRRVYATQCPQPLQTSSSSHNGSASHITVLVECAADNWKLYVPVKLTLRVPMVTAATSLARGQIITSQNISISMEDMLRFRRQSFSVPDMLFGAKVKRSLQVGDVITQNDVCIICRNDTVIIHAGSGGMSITTKGTALSDGILGEQIKVKNNKSNRIIDAKVSGVGKVLVQF